MPNTQFAKLPVMSNRIYEEWLKNTVVVNSCDRSFEGELNLETRELDIPIYHDITIHQTTIKEHELKPAPIEFLSASVKRVSIDKIRYNHWGKTKIGTIINNLSQEDSVMRKKLVNRWAVSAEKELVEYCAQLPANQEIDMITLLGGTGAVTKDNVLKFLDILKAFVVTKNMEFKDFYLFGSEKFETILRDAQLPLASLDANETFRTGSVGIVNGVDVRKMQVASVTNRNANNKLVEAEWMIWKTSDGIQYVVPYKTTATYELPLNEVLLGGTGFQTVEYYDFFNLYPTRLYKVKTRYAGAKNPPTTFQ